MIPCANPGAQYSAHKDAIDAAIANVLASGAYIMGQEVEAFETEFAAYLGAAHCIGVGSGTEALQICQLGLDLKAGDEVLTTNQDYGRMLDTWDQRARRDGIKVTKISFPVPTTNLSELTRAIEAETGSKISQSYLSQIESGARPHLTNTTRQTLAQFFKVHPGYLVDDPEGYHPELISELRNAPEDTTPCRCRVACSLAQY